MAQPQFEAMERLTQVLADEADPSLGIYTEFAAGRGAEASRRVERYELQALVKQLLPDERVRVCLSHVLPQAEGVAVFYSPRRRRAQYGNLLTCGSVWTCPVCSSWISMKRREKLGQAVDRWRWRGGYVFHAVYTVQHSGREFLHELLRTMGQAQRAMTGHRDYRWLRDEIGWRYTVKALEVTWGERDGWHPHYHALIFCERGRVDPGQLQQELYEIWAAAAGKQGLRMSAARGVRVDRADDAAAAYVAKFGKEPSKAPWSVADELTKWHLKHGQASGDGDVHFTPWDLLRWLRDTGERAPAGLFETYHYAFKGRNQLRASPGFWGAMELEEDKGDEELAAELDDDAVLLAMLTPEEWQAVRGLEKRGQVLEVARRGDAEVLTLYVRQLSQEWIKARGLPNAKAVRKDGVGRA